MVNQQQQPQQRGGMFKAFFGKVTDALGGVVGQMSASMAVTADRFVENAAIGDLYEITAAEIALRRSSSDDVRSIARDMIDDHMTSTHQLQAALETSEARGVAPPPPTLDGRRQTMIRHLEEASDEAFDTTYVDQQLLAHEETVTLMRAYRDGGDNPQLRSYAAGTAPVVERHLEHIKRLRAAAS
jgi:putative membrane protein